MRYLAIEAGATHSRAGLYTNDGALLAEAQGGPCNPTAYGWEASIHALAMLAGELLGPDPSDAIVLAGIAGAVNDKARREAARRLCAELGVLEARVAEDLYPILYANAGEGAALLAIAGTGSNALGCTNAGSWAQVGGRGHVYGDEGSAYAIGIAALRAVAMAEDGLGPQTSLSDSLLRATRVDTSSDLIAWAGAAGKNDLAGLARSVMDTADAGDAVAAECIESQARLLVRQILAVAKKLHLDSAAPVYGHGGLFENCPRYRAAFEVGLADSPLHFATPKLKGPQAVFALATLTTIPFWLAVQRHREGVPGHASYSPTEGASKRPKPLDALSAREIVVAMAETGEEAARAVAQAMDTLTPVVDVGGACLRAGGRILYVGAGTSGRLGVLDAAECPPTFGVEPSRVQGLIAGGLDALTHSIEGAEDDAPAGGRAIEEHAVTPSDLVVGIAASGNTPYVAGALERAAALGAVTALVTSNPLSTITASHRVILNTGAELVAGSTRLKAGTAAKIALNIISTGAMALAGFVYQGRMIGMRPVNHKLRERAVHMVAELAACSETNARTSLEATGWHITAAILYARDGLSSADAVHRAKRAACPRDAITND